MNEMEQKVLKTLSHQYKNTKQKNSGGLHRDHQPPVHPEPPQRYGTFPDGYPRRIRTVQPCPEKRFRFRTPQDRRGIRQHHQQQGQKKPGNPDLLSREQTGDRGKRRGQSGGLVQNIMQQYCLFQIHPLQSQKGIAEGFRLCHRRTDHGEGRNPGQRGIL